MRKKTLPMVELLPKSFQRVKQHSSRTGKKQYVAASELIDAGADAINRPVAKIGRAGN